jgi:hypothetical protein
MRPLTPSPSIIPYGSAVSYDPQSAVKAELGRLIHAAIINKRFCQKLLTNPLSCVEDGYCGESFHFPSEFKERIQYLQAETLESLSIQLLQIANSPRIVEKAVLHFQ